jgi:flagella basal body P-ring formation protein FlgA
MSVKNNVKSSLLVGLFVGLGMIAQMSVSRAEDPYLRENVEIDGPQVTLGDLFANPGHARDISVLKSPAPGEQILLSINDAFELANAHGLGWRPVAPFEYATITRAWRTIDRAEIVNAIGIALSNDGAGANLTVDLPRVVSKIKIARGAIADLAIEDLAYDANTGRFRATLVVRDSAGGRRRDAVFGTAIAYVELPVLSSRLRRDQVISDSDIVWRPFREARVPIDAVYDPATMIGLSPTRMLTPGKPVLAAQLRAPTIVRKGAMVVMRLTTPKMRIVATGRALESGALGDFIQIRNTQSKLIVDAIVTGPERVSVTAAGFEIVAQQ